jgi:SAM-dependent methyltransferase
MDSTQRFSNRVDNYVKYRPGYPRDVLRFLSETKGFNPTWTVADIGSGTGISTSLFLDNGNTVYAVEPNAPMRNKAEELLGSRPGFISIDGKAENTGLPASAVDLIIAGQAFHWFDPIPAKKEFIRILRPGGAIALMWNERQKSSGFEKAYEDLLQTYGTDYEKVNHSNITEKEIAAFFQRSPFEPEQQTPPFHPTALQPEQQTPAFHPTALQPGQQTPPFHSTALQPREQTAPLQSPPFQLRVADNRQSFDWERLIGRLLSSSYIPLEPADTYNKMIRHLKNIFDKHQQNGFVYFDYQTKVYIA